MSTDRVRSQLEAFRISGRDARGLLLLPQVYVGWASRRRDVAALEALLDITASRAGLGAGCLGLARGWLFERPTRTQFQSGFALLRAMRRAPDNPLIATSDLLEALLWASQAARLDREPAAKGIPAPVTSAVRRALSDAEAWLEVDMGDVLTDLLADDVPSNGQEKASEKFADLSDAELDQATASLEVVADDEHSAVLVRREDRGGAAPASAPAAAPFLLVRATGTRSRA
jgi:hypothetical protein